MRKHLSHRMAVHDLISRLRVHEKFVSTIISYGNSGWQTTLAWNPVASLKLQDQDQNPSQLIEEFVQEQQANDRLLIGYLSYDLGCRLMNVTNDKPSSPETPLAYIAAYDNCLAFDADTIVAHYQAQSFPNEVESIIKRQVNPNSKPVYDQPLQPTMNRAAYFKAYQKIQTYIKTGDVYQINLTQQLRGSTSLSGRELFNMLSIPSESTYQAYIEDGDLEILSLSPEQFIEVKDHTITTSPIKGTRPRGANDAQDRLLKKDLASNPKDQAELNMITDLMRNDLGAICKVGSIKVEQQRQLTAYPTLWHAHSTITGQLSKNISSIKALLNVIPGGSITGCPKKRAMEIINDLEPVRRGLAMGSVFCLQPNDTLDSNIAIRTMIKRNRQLYLNVGGGIVYDSDESSEYQESLDKAASFVEPGSKLSGKDI